jgi:hypothetical protein
MEWLFSDDIDDASSYRPNVDCPASYAVPALQVAASAGGVPTGIGKRIIGWTFPRRRWLRAKFGKIKP